MEVPDLYFQFYEPVRIAPQKKSTFLPQQTVNLKDWTHYYSVGGVFTEDWRHEDVMVLLEAVRPADLARFLQHEMDVAPVEKVHVSSSVILLTFLL